MGPLFRDHPNIRPDYARKHLSIRHPTIFLDHTRKRLTVKHPTIMFRDPAQPVVLVRSSL